MDAGLLWIFLFIALAIGWLLGRFSKPKSKVAETPYQPSDNMKHRLQLLFDSYTDESLDQFIHSLEVTPDTVGIHISIGKHFRTEGEVEKAILIHQNLMAHPELSDQASEPVVYELAKDYKAAGLFDRAESLLLQLNASKTYGFKSSQLLLDVYEREKDWESALNTAATMNSRKGSDVSLRAAHYCCELAEQKRQLGDVLSVRRLLKKALSLNKRCIRAHLMSAELELEQDRFRHALNHLKQVAEMTPEYIAAIVSPMLRCTCETQSYAAHQTYLQALYKQTGQVCLMLAIVESLEAEGKSEEAFQFLKTEATLHPSLAAMEVLTQSRYETRLGADNDTLKVALGLLAKLNQERPSFQCVQCGFKGETLHWMCPSCKSWQTTQPVVEYIAETKAATSQHV